MDLQLTDKVAVITGSSRGLGLASARALVGEGARVCVCARGAERLEEAVRELRAEAGDDEAVVGVEADLNTASGVETVIDRTVTAYGGIDILVNNVGKAGGGGLLETTDPEWQAALDATLYPAIRASRLAVPHMRARGGGVIIMIASIWGRESGGRMTYNAVKAAEISLARSHFQVGPGRSARRRSRRRWRCSLHASSRSVGSAAPKRWVRSSRSLPRRGPAG
jgi:3-oxoacyl-[acyl-carrier protein] reductase